MATPRRVLGGITTIRVSYVENKSPEVPQHYGWSDYRIVQSRLRRRLAWSAGKDHFAIRARWNRGRFCSYPGRSFWRHFQAAILRGVSARCWWNDWIVGRR